MTKKFFLLFTTIFALFLCSSAVFANNDGVGQEVSNAGNEVQGSWDKLGNSVQNAGNHIANGVSNMGKAVTNTTGIMGMTNDNKRNDNGYTATRTATSSSTVLGMNGTMWTWFVFAVLAVVVISLVWYYGMQQKDNTKRHEQ